jgi:hypothetical protein
MQRDCEYTLSDGKYVCRFCGDVRNKLVRRNCRSRRGLGDLAASALRAIGVKKKDGCGCARRQATLNRLFPYSATIWRRRLRLALRHIAGLPRWLVSSVRSSDSNRD